MLEKHVLARRQARDICKPSYYLQRRAAYRVSLLNRETQVAPFTCRVVIWYLGSSGLEAATYIKFYLVHACRVYPCNARMEGTEASTEDIQDGTGQETGLKEEEIGRREEMHTSGQLIPGSSACNVT